MKYKISKDKGLYKKYNVTRVDGKPIKGGNCIVMEFGDPIARVAIKAWTKELDKNGYHDLAYETRTLLKKWASK